MNEKKHLQLNDLEVYKASLNLSNYVWSKVEQWDHFAKQIESISSQHS